MLNNSRNRGVHMSKYGVIFFLLFSLSKSWAIQVNCGKSAQCSPSVAAIEIELPPDEAQRLGQPNDYCTGFLIAKDKIMTNSHCIWGRVGKPSQMRHGKSCISASIHFPEVTVENKTYNAESTGCFSIETILDYDPRVSLDWPDFTILIINPVQRPFFNVSKNGITNGEINKSIVYDFDLSGKEVVATQRTNSNCQAYQKNDFKNFNSSFAPMVFYINCPIVGGNSGGVLLNGKNEAVAITISTQSISGKKSYDGSFFPQASTASNLSCIDTLTDSESRAEVKKLCDLNAFTDQQWAFNESIIKRFLTERDSRLNVTDKSTKVINQYKKTGQLVYREDTNFRNSNGMYKTDFFPRIGCFYKSAATERPYGELNLPIFRGEAAYGSDFKFHFLKAEIVPMVVNYIIDTPVSAFTTSQEVLVKMYITMNGVALNEAQVKIPFCE